MTKREPARAIRQKRTDGGKAGPLVEEVPRPIPDVLVILLLIATAISAGLWLYERESALPYEAIAIFAVVLLNAIMGYIQEARAEQAVAALRRMSAARPTNGKTQRHRPPPRRGGDARFGKRDRFRRDRDVDEKRDDGASSRDG